MSGIVADDKSGVGVKKLVRTTADDIGHSVLEDDVLLWIDLDNSAVELIGDHGVTVSQSDCVRWQRTRDAV